MTQLPHPKGGYNELWRTSAYDTLETLAMLFENPRTHTGKGYRDKTNAVRGCAGCGLQKKRKEYSYNQWRKGEGMKGSICLDCVSAKKSRSGGGGGGGSSSNAEEGNNESSNNHDDVEESFPSLTADALQVHNKKNNQVSKKVERGEMERRQFNCPLCPKEGRGKNVFFKKVPKVKPIVKCPKVSIMYVILPWVCPLACLYISLPMFRLFSLINCMILMLKV